MVDLSRYIPGALDSNRAADPELYGEGDSYADGWPVIQPPAPPTDQALGQHVEHNGWCFRGPLHGKQFSYSHGDRIVVVNSNTAAAFEYLWNYNLGLWAPEDWTDEKVLSEFVRFAFCGLPSPSTP